MLKNITTEKIYQTIFITYKTFWWYDLSEAKYAIEEWKFQTVYRQFKRCNNANAPSTGISGINF